MKKSVNRLRRKYLRSNPYKKVAIIIGVTLWVILIGGMIGDINETESTSPNPDNTVLKLTLTHAIPGLDLVDPDEILMGPSIMLDKLLFATLGIEMDDPHTLFGTQFELLQTHHPRIIAMGNGYNDEDDPQDESKESDEEPLLEPAATQLEDNEVEEDTNEFNIEPVEEEFSDDSSGSNMLVSIYHSHTTESFIPTSGDAFSQDFSETIVRVGEELVDELNTRNIDTVHSKKVHDLPTRQDSYMRSESTVYKLLDEHPDTDIMIDLHRDGIDRQTTTAEINGEQVGRILLLVGSGSNHPNWRSNYRFAFKLQQELEQIDPDLSRGIRTRNFSYNQEAHPRSVLVEIGGHENSLEEALNTVPYLADALDKVEDDLE